MHGAFNSHLAKSYFSVVPGDSENRSGKIITFYRFAIETEECNMQAQVSL